MPDILRNKVIYDGNVLIDLTGDTVEASDVASGKSFHLPSGAIATGTNTKDSDTSDATAVASEILTGSSAYVRGSKVNGTMPNNGAVSGTISTKAQVYTVPLGYHDGSGTVQIASAEQNKIIAENIRQGVTILGVEGSMSGQEDVHAQSKTATPSASQQTILPDTGYNYLTQVVVNAIPYTETLNSAGGYTVTIG